MVVQTQAIYFWNQSWKESDPTYNDSEIEWSISRSTPIEWRNSKFRVFLCRIRLFPTLISKIKWIWSVLPLIKWSILDATWWPIENQPWFEFHDFIRYISFSLCFSPFKVNFRSLNPLFSINMSSFTDEDGRPRPSGQTWIPEIWIIQRDRFLNHFMKLTIRWRSVVFSLQQYFELFLRVYSYRFDSIFLKIFCQNFVKIQ